MSSTTRDEVREAVTRTSREEGGRVLALLAKRFSDLDLADDAVQEAFVRALDSWADGIPRNPAAWIYTVAKNYAVDRLRRDAANSRRLATSAHELVDRSTPRTDGEEEPDMIDDRFVVGDERLRLLLLCCHPALDIDSQVALTLRLVGGLTTSEIAAAFLLPEATLAQRIVRAKKKIRHANIPLSIPAFLGERVEALLRVLYLVFNEGYLSRGTEHTVRVDLAEEAIRLTRQTREELPDSAEVEGLLALELFHHSRRMTRTDELGEIVLLENQNRPEWDGEGISEANEVIRHAMARMTPGVFQVQALIASHHANAPTAADTDWAAIAALYAQLARMVDNPVVELNRAVAVGMAEGPDAGLNLLDNVSGLDGYYLLHAARGELRDRAGLDSRAHFARALDLATNDAEKRHLRRRIEEVRG